MPFNGSGTFTPPGADFPAVTLTVISSSKYNNVVSDIAGGLTNCVTRDGQSPMTAALPMGGQFITGLGLGSAAAPAIRWGASDGIYSPGVGLLSVSTAGAEILRWSATGMRLVVLGTAAAPSMLWGTNDGIYSPGAGQLAIASSGVLRLSVGTTGAWTMAAPTSALSALTITGATGAAALVVNGVASNVPLAIVPADATTAIDVTKSLNSSIRALTVTNVNTGTAAFVDLVLTNGTSYLQLVHGGTAHATLANTSVLYGVGTGGLRLDATAGALSLYQAGIERFKIDTSGRWLNSGNTQPRCYVTDSGSFTFQGSDVFVTFSGETYDIGNNFSSTTFTAPVSGLYSASLNFLITNAAASVQSGSVYMEWDGISIGVWQGTVPASSNVLINAAMSKYLSASQTFKIDLSNNANLTVDSRQLSIFLNY